MAVEPLIALEAAQAELGTLYTQARAFTALQAQAEAEWLPHIVALGSRMRHLLRAAQLSEDEFDRVAVEIQGLRTDWHAALDGVRSSVAYQQTLGAFVADRQDELAALIPQLFADLRPCCPPPAIYFPVSPSTGRRRPGSSPFLSPAGCADKIQQLLTDGIVAEGDGSEWWERELPSISGSPTLAMLESPIALHLAAPDVRVTVFSAVDDPTLRIFTSRLQAPMTIVLAREATDEWWEAHDDSYHTFRDALRRELTARGHAQLLSVA